MIIITAREKGRSLPETGYEYRYVVIYRAVKRGDDGNMPDSFGPMDYVATSENFARGHADHNAAVGDESVVLKAMVKASDVFEAYNPGEYFYDGPLVKGKVAYNQPEEGKK